MKICSLILAMAAVCVLTVQGYGQSAVDPQKRYACLPCGYSCDAAHHLQPGRCEVCGMDLVEESTIVYKDIDFYELCSRIKVNPKIVLLDVRTAEEFSNTNPDIESFGRFTKAINVNVTNLEYEATSLEQYKDSEIIVYCSHSHRSPRASYFLSTHGFNNVKNVRGGVSILDPNQLQGCLKDYYIAFPARK